MALSNILQSKGVTVFAWGRWLALYCAFSFAMLGVDAAMNHHLILAKNPWAIAPLIFAPLAVAVSLVNLFSARWRQQAWILGGLAVIVGTAGTLFHNVPTILARGDQSIWQALLNAYRPVFAPAAFAATGLLLFLITWGEHWQHKHTQTAKESE